MRRTSQIESVILGLIIVFAGGAGAALAGDGSATGSFAVNNDLPAGWDLSTVLIKDGSTEILASHPVTSHDSSVAFSFAGLDPGPYRVRLLASKEDIVLALAETAVLTVGSETSETSETSGNIWKAMGSGGAVSGATELLGQPPEGRMILIRVRRVDIDVEGQFPDQLNAFTIEVEPEEIAAGSVAYEVSGLSYGLYAVELIAYHYESHTTEPLGAHPERLAVDLDHEKHRDVDFTVSFE